MERNNKMGGKSPNEKHKVMIKRIIATMIVAGVSAASANCFAVAPLGAAANDAVVSVLTRYLPGTVGIGRIGVDKVVVDDANRTVTVECNENVAYIPLRAESLAQLKKDVSAALDKKYSDYLVKMYVVSRDRKGVETERTNLDNLMLFAPKKVVGPTEKTPFVVDVEADRADKGLQGKNIALWQSHGWYFESKLNRWEWQRARIFQTVEDLYTQSYVMPFLMPMLRNAGAYVMSPRERDTNTTEIVVDNDGGNASGTVEYGRQWTATGIPGFGYTKSVLHNGDNLFREGTALSAVTTDNSDNAATIKWITNIPRRDTYAVYVSYQSLPESSEDAEYTINTLGGPRHFRVNQKMGGGTWIYLGHFLLDAGNKPVVELSTLSGTSGRIVTADAVKIGGGMGNVERIVGEPLDSIDYEYVGSGYPRFTEGARYWLQWAGAPDSVYTPSGNVNDYTDDYRCRGLWVNWLTGGSSMLPDRAGLHIPVDLSFAWHTDAGTTMNDSIIGTLGIYCTDGHERGTDYANGTSRYASRDFTDLVMTNITNDIRRTYEPNWTRRGMWDQSYYEARVPEVPGMLLELLSHQNFADMKYGLDPEFRFVVSRAVYKGMLQFLANRDGIEYVVQPLPVRKVAITAKDARGNYTLTWQPTVDSLESTATPTYYNIEERIGNGAFVKIARVTEPTYTINVTDDAIHSYRVIAGNDGGVSFPSMVTSLCYRPDAPTVNIVNGFTRVSAPDWFDSGEIAGFYDTRDHGVPYMEDISYIGETFEFRRNLPWMDDDAAGFGASRANYEDKVIAGNTFDYIYTHGEAIRAAGYGFVSSSVEAFVDAPETANTPRIVDLILGKQKEVAKGRGVYGTYFKTFPVELQNKISKMTKDGTSFFVSGAFVATDLWDNQFSTKEVAERDQKFATEVLGYHWRVGQATVEGSAYQVATRFKSLNANRVYPFYADLNKECYAVESPDSFYPADDKKGCTFMRYTENNLIAGTAYENGAYRTVVIGFPFETIKDCEARTQLMSKVLNFFAQPYKTLPAKDGKKKATKRNKKK